MTKTSWRRQISPMRPQFLRCPDPSRRIVGIAEQHQLHVRIGRRAFEGFEIDRVGVVAVDQVAPGGFAAAVGDGYEKVVVDGCLHQHLVARTGQRPENGRQGRNHTGHGVYPCPLRGPAVPPGEPSDDRRIVTLRDFRIAENPVFDPAAKGLDDGGAVLKSISATHIGRMSGAGCSSHFTEFVPRRGISSSKSYFIMLYNTQNDR